MNICDSSSLVNCIIRPRRDDYKFSDIEEKTPKQSYREDYRLSRGNDFMVVSVLYSISKLERCVLYLHGNGGSRLEGLEYAQIINSQDWTLVVFDFLGCGLSSGEYITLGCKQAEQTEIVISFLRSINPHIKLCIWGRSMGAVTALRLSSCSQITCMILDSPFCNLKQMSMTLKSKYSFLPRFMKELVFLYLNQKVQQQAGFSLNEVEITCKASAPALFIGSKTDKMVPFQQILQAFKAYKGSKQFHQIQLGHNQFRDNLTINKIINFIRTSFQKDLLKKVPLSGSRRIDSQSMIASNYHKPSTGNSNNYSYN